MEYKPIIGLEVHVELNTKSKMFCSCSNDPNERHPNMLICPICMGHPGTLPVINQEAVKKVIKTGLALNCEIPESSKFDRKNYFYPDLPKGYQISQYDAPLCKEGYLEILNFEENIQAVKSEIRNPKFETNSKFQIPNSKRIRIQRIHLEEDTGKLIHPEGKDYSLVDFNRAGIPLMELVTEPDITSAKEARIFAEEFQIILRYLDVSNADMEKGELRVEANISLLPLKSKIQNPKSKTNSKLKIQNSKLGTKVELKNINSFRAVERAINYEIQRQTEVLGAGQKVVQETRGWDDVKGKSFSQRSKEEAHDYRYFPEPDLPPIKISNFKFQVSKDMVELPQQKRERFKKEYNLQEKEIEILVREKDLASYFEKCAEETQLWMRDKKVEESKKCELFRIMANYLISDLKGLMAKENIDFKNLKINPENFAELILMLYRKELSSRTGKDVLLLMFRTGGDPSNIVEEKNLKQVSDKTEIKNIVEKIIKANKKAVDDYKKGKQNAIQFLIGQVLRETKGRANPGEARKIIQEILKS